MPRKLPWKQEGSGTPARLKKPITSSDASAKRKRAVKPASESDSDMEPVPPRKGTSDDRAPSTSPPLEPPSERFMVEGLENDDKYRMVEDEFLSVAKQFTVHLHTAEYKRQEKMVKSRNADTISSISRPVTGKMPDHTKRRVQGIELAKTQRSALAGLLGKKNEGDGISDDSDDGDGLPYVGTTLHGLMDSPRRKAASLAKLGSVATTTRSAAGFSKPAAQSKNAISESPKPKRALKNGQMTQSAHDSSTESSDEEDDLDAPIPTPRLSRVDLKPTVSKTLLSSPPASSVNWASHIKATAPARKPSSSVAASTITEPDQGLPRESYTETTSARVPANSGPRLSRFEQARRLKAQREKEQKAKKNLDVIPTFL